MAKKKKKDNRRPRKPKSDLEAKMPRPRPITIHGARYYIEHAREYPIFGSWIMKGWQESGITPVVIGREQSPDEVIFGSYLVDLYCLGVKDSLCNANLPLKRFKNNLPDLCSGKPEPCDIGLAHELVYGAIDFARRYGFEPHPDFQLARPGPSRLSPVWRCSADSLGTQALDIVRGCVEMEPGAQTL